MSEVSVAVFGVWFLIGAVLVFFMQAGFAMVETGFTRAKNAGNIIMKNLMDFCIGTVMFILIGYSLLLGEDWLGIIGLPSFDIFSNYENFNWSGFIFNLVFCATTATIVSGAMAERTKFISYCVYSALISGIVYPIEAHWIWGGGWLAQMGFHDFAGSAAIHMVGGVAALIGAKILGARIGKFSTDKNGKVNKVNAIPGHSLTLGALGVFILWFGWYGFNGAAATSVEQLGSIFVTTTIAPAVAAVVCMVVTWKMYKKPDVSMCLNAALGGLVGITAGCNVMDAMGSIIVGAVAGVLVIFGVWLLDYVLNIDDPVGAVAVHMMCGIWGTVAVGLFATPTAPDSSITGLFYGGGISQLMVQLIGVVSVCAWTAVTMTAVFFLIKATVGLRVTAEEEVAGLDMEEHGLASSYADFMPAPMGTDLKPYVTASDISSINMDKAIPVINKSQENAKMTKVVVVTNQAKFENLKSALDDIGITGMTVTQVLGYGVQKGGNYYRGVEVEAKLMPKVKVEIVISKIPVALLVETVKKALYTGSMGDGKIFIYDVEEVVRISTGEQGYDALQDEDKETA